MHLAARSTILFALLGAAIVAVVVAALWSALAPLGSDDRMARTAIFASLAAAAIAALTAIAWATVNLRLVRPLARLTRELQTAEWITGHGGVTLPESPELTELALTVRNLSDALDRARHDTVRRPQRGAAEPPGGHSR